VRLLGSRVISVARARALGLKVYWLGPRFAGLPLTGIAVLRYTGGEAVRAEYGRVAVWTYRAVVPPQLLANRVVPLKSLPVGSTVIQVYSAAGGRAVAEYERSGVTLAIVAPGLDFATIVHAGAHLRSLR
jgi:hypothetical protein